MCTFRSSALDTIWQAGQNRFQWLNDCSGFAFRNGQHQNPASHLFCCYWLLAFYIPFWSWKFRLLLGGGGEGSRSRITALSQPRNHPKSGRTQKSCSWFYSAQFWSKLGIPALWKYPPGLVLPQMFYVQTRWSAPTSLSSRAKDIFLNHTPLMNIQIEPANQSSLTSSNGRENFQC